MTLQSVPHKLTLKDSQAMCPTLTRALAQMQESYAIPDVDYGLQGRALLFKAEHLAGLGLEPYAPYGMLIRLPDAFEEHLDLLAESRLEPINICTLDLLRKITVVSFDDFNEAFIGVIGSAYQEILELCAPYDYETDRHPEAMIPFVLIAGKTVIIRTVETEEGWHVVMQGAQIGSGPNWRPYRIYSDEDMAKAEQRKQLYGDMPWVGKVWSYPTPGSFPWLMMNASWLDDLLPDLKEN